MVETLLENQRLQQLLRESDNFMSANESTIPCPHWEECSGCPLIENHYKAQLLIKEESIKGAFMNAGFSESLIKLKMKKCVSSPKTLGYRNKAKWVIQGSSKSLDQVKMGIYKQGTHDVVDIPECSVHAPMINVISLFIKEQLVISKVPIANDDFSGAALRYLIVRYSFRDNKAMCVFVTTRKNVPGLPKLVDALKEKFGKKIVAIVQNINNEPGNVLLGEANRYLQKNAELTEQMGALRVSIGPLSFLQVNSAQASKLYLRVRQIVGKGPFTQGLDLYGGLGLMGMHLASKTENVLSVEEVGPAALEGVTAARRNKVNNVLHLCADALEGVKTFFKEWGVADWVVLNPPRKGCEKKLLEALLQRPPKKIVYVSCNPKTLARDCHILVDQGGYTLKAIEPFDMFPQTAHVETLVMLEKKKRKSSSRKAGARSGRAEGKTVQSSSDASKNRNKSRKRSRKGSKTLH